MASPGAVRYAAVREGGRVAFRTAGARGPAFVYIGGSASHQDLLWEEPGFRQLYGGLGDIARDTGLKILGPNCLGIANYLRRARISFSEYPAPREIRGISVGIASQSGALSQSLAQAIECGASVSHISRP